MAGHDPLNEPDPGLRTLANGAVLETNARACPPYGWLAAIATSVLDMQQGLVPRIEIPMGARGPPAEIRGKIRGDPNHQAAKRLRVNLTQASAPTHRDQVKATEPLTAAPRDMPGPSTVPGSEERGKSQGCGVSEVTPRIGCHYDEEPCPPCLLGQNARDTSVCFLGTGSAEPSKYRSVAFAQLILRRTIPRPSSAAYHNQIAQSLPGAPPPSS